jgi:hypothetical protein
MKDSTLDTLDAFLTEEMPGDRQDISEIDKLLLDVRLVYATVFDQRTAWPYQIVKDTTQHPPTSLSHSTTAMILAALLHLDGRLSTPEEKAAPQWSSAWAENDLPDEDRSIIHRSRANIDIASALLLAEIFEAQPTGPAPGAPATTPSTPTAAPATGTSKDNKLSMVSHSYGLNDVFTLAWVAEVSKADWTGPSSEAAKTWGRVSQLCLALANDKWNASKQFTNLTALFDPKTVDPESTSRPVEHAFPALKLVQTIRRIGGNKHGALPECYPYFERVLHQQLSFSAIPDSRFDPAELMFCLEGMLQCQRNTVDRALFDRVISVLTSVQSENAFWRPVKPFLATEQGFALFPVSVEVANSLLRSCAIFDQDSALQATYSSRCIPLARRYWQWLRARTVRFRLEPFSSDRDLVGWHSEHVNEPTKIHLWETSQVIEFLLSFRNLLRSHIARTALIKSRFATVLQPRKEWDEDQEPVRMLGERLCVFKRIREEFIEPHLREPRNAPRSMLLYGPPGTGKTRVADSIAKALNRRLITITVSDFLASGGAQVEARAKDIFQVLMYQPPCVVLFDEIDHFLLNRDSDRYTKQETIFQFMTPGMLTKLSELRNRGAVLFVVATNYEERIDPAIKRPGRIDHRYLLLPSDGHSRRGMLEKLASKSSEPAGQLTVFDKRMDEPAWKKLVDASLFLGWNDIKTAVATIENGSQNFDAFETLLRDYPRITLLGTYTSRLSTEGGQETAISEFLCLVALSLESSRAFEERELLAIRAARKLLGVPVQKITPNIVRKYAPDLNSSGADSVAKALREVTAAL